MNNWKNLNGGAISCFDYIYNILQLEEINTDICFAFTMLFWPEFIRYKEFVLLKNNFLKTKFNDLKSLNTNIEFWMNFLLIDSYFEHDVDQYARAQVLAYYLKKDVQNELHG